MYIYICIYTYIYIYIYIYIYTSSYDLQQCVPFILKIAPAI